MREEPKCGKCGGVMTPKDSKIRPELFLHDACLPDELKPPAGGMTDFARWLEREENELIRRENETVSQQEGDVILKMIALIQCEMLKLPAGTFSQCATKSDMESP
jgi:hypothetical protein